MTALIIYLCSIVIPLIFSIYDIRKVLKTKTIDRRTRYYRKVKRKAKRRDVLELLFLCLMSTFVPVVNTIMSVALTFGLIGIGYKKLGVTNWLDVEI